jgi:tetratricopeptide (TPR) repeat protein
MAKDYVPNDLLRRCRERLFGTQQAMADAANKHLAPAYLLTGNDIGKLERGVVDRPSTPRCTALRTVCGAATDAEIGLVRRSKTRTDHRGSSTRAGQDGHPEFGVSSTDIPSGVGAAWQAQLPVGPMMQHRAQAVRPSSRHTSEDAADMVTMSVRLDGREVIVSLSRRDLLQVGVGPFLEAFAFGQNSEMVREAVEQPRRHNHVTVTSPTHLDEILVHLREQWHAQVKTDNLLGPRFALASVLSQIAVIDALRKELRDVQRLEVVRLGAQYAESAAWLYEDSGDMTKARNWTSQALEWAYEANDKHMLAWTTFRRSQQAATTGDAAEVIGLAHAARRDEELLVTPMRAAIRVQEAYGHALDGNEGGSQRLLDEAHAWAASDTAGDARDGHGSYCTPGYIEIQRASCWLATGKAKKAVSLYEEGLRTLAPVYQRNRAAAQSWLAKAYFADNQIERAAHTAHAALPVARSTGSRRILEEIKSLSTDLARHRQLPSVAALLNDLACRDA